MFSVLMLYPHSHFKLGMDKININFMMLSNFLWGSGFGVEKCFEALHVFIYKGLQIVGASVALESTRYPAYEAGS